MENTITPVNLICPNCHNQSIYSKNILIEFENNTCPKCKKVFISQLATVRTKNTKTVRELHYHSLRIYTPTNAQKLIEFSTPKGQSVELKQGDNIALLYANQTLCIVQNVTINQYTIIQDKRGCAKNAAVLLVVMLFLLFY
jgi:Zn-finger nucleic acid-binding protein